MAKSVVRIKTKKEVHNVTALRNGAPRDESSAQKVLYFTRILS